MANNYVVTVQAGDGTVPVIAGDPRPSLKRLASVFEALASGSKTASHTVSVRNTAVAATGTLTMASSSGAVGGIINGVTVTVTWATSDTASAAALAAAINTSVNALVNQHVTATSALGVVTLTSKQFGAAGNAITLAASGPNVTASGARLTGGSEASSVITFAL
jgi:phage tail sheath gpL-like